MLGLQESGYRPGYRLECGGLVLGLQESRYRPGYRLECGGLVLGLVAWGSRVWVWG